MNAQFCLNKEAPVFNIINNEEQSAKLSRASAITLRELISDGRFESDDRTLMRKPVFLFGDSIDADESPLIVGNYRWLRKIGDIFLFLPIMLRMVPLSYLQSMSVPRPMEWNLTRSHDGFLQGRSSIINLSLLVKAEM